MAEVMGTGHQSGEVLDTDDPLVQYIPGRGWTRMSPTSSQGKGTVGDLAMAVATAPAALVDKAFGTEPGATTTPFVYPETPSPYAAQLAEERARLQAIAGGVMSPAERQAREQSQSSARMMEGLSRGLPTQYGASRERMGRGAVSALTASQAQDMNVLRAQQQASARQQQLAMTAALEGQDRQEAQDRMSAELAQRIAERKQLEYLRDQKQAGISTATQIGLKATSKPDTSDKRKKKNIRSGDSDVEQMLNAISAKTYEMKSGGGPTVGVIAQDLQQGGPMGEKMVGKDKGTLTVSAGPSPVLAALAYLNDKIDMIAEQRNA